MRGWKDLEVVDTIYEEDHEEEEDGSNSVSLTPSPTISPTPPHSSSPPPPSLESTVDAWSKATGCKRDVIVRVKDQCFHLHRDPLIYQSRYLRRKLTESSDVTVTPPSGVTAETFADAALFCYGFDVALTPSNLAALWVVAEWLEMAEDDRGGGGGSLVRLTEDYFRRDVAGDPAIAAVVLRTCVGLLAGAAGLAVRCVEVVASQEGGDGGWLQDLAMLSAEEFEVIAEEMSVWFAHDHDLLYRIVDYYLENHGGKLTEEEKTRICYTISCTKLSHQLLIHLVQNPRLPLRFIVQAMLVDHLHTHHSILDRKPPVGETLGAILQRDTTLRQAAQLRSTMEATSFRIESLEQDLAGLRRRLRWSEEKRAEMEATRSESFRSVVVASSGKSCSGDSSRKTRGFGRKLVHGFKSLFQPSSTKPGADDGQVSSNGGKVEESASGHRRNHSFS